MIKIRKYYIENDDGERVKVHYWLDGRRDGRKCLAICAKEYGNRLHFLPNVKNDTDAQIDHYAKDIAYIFEDDPLYAKLRPQVEKVLGTRSSEGRSR